MRALRSREYKSSAVPELGRVFVQGNIGRVLYVAARIGKNTTINIIPTYT